MLFPRQSRGSPAWGARAGAGDAAGVGLAGQGGPGARAVCPCAVRDPVPGSSDHRCRGTRCRSTSAARPGTCARS